MYACVECWCPCLFLPSPPRDLSHRIPLCFGKLDSLHCVYEEKSREQRVSGWRGPLPAPCASADPVAEPRRGLSGDPLPPRREGWRPGQEVLAQAGSPADATLSRPGLPWPCAHTGRRDVPPSLEAIGAWAGSGKPSLLSQPNDFQTTRLLSLQVPFGGARR